ncbi:hypothetical protein ACFLRN_02480 [Thermoproteota archaeon]
MRIRTFLAFFNLVNFLVMIFVTAYIMYNYWDQIQDWWLVLYSYYVILGCSGLVIAFWIGIDAKRLERYSEKIKNLEKKLIELEKKIKLIKPRS